MRPHPTRKGADAGTVTQGLDLARRAGQEYKPAAERKRHRRGFGAPTVPSTGIIKDPEPKFQIPLLHIYGFSPAGYGNKPLLFQVCFKESYFVWRRVIPLFP